MLRAHSLLVASFALWPAACLPPSIAGAADVVADLSHPFDRQTIYWPTEPGFELQSEKAGMTERGYFYASNRFAAPEHGGTHIDAPWHFAEGGQKVDEIPLQRLIGPAVRVDLRAKAAVDPDYLIRVEDLQQWETQHGASLEDKIVLLDTGYAQFWGDRVKYLGTAAVGAEAVEQLRFPGLDPTAATWLAARRRVRCVGIDTASIDYGRSQQFGSHVNLFKHNVPALENLADLSGLPATGFHVSALPMKIAGGSGAPCRVVAQWDR